MVYDKENAELNTNPFSETIELDNIRKQLALYIKENERLANEFRTLKHSALNILHNINCYIEFEDWTGLDKYSNLVLEKIKNISTPGLSSIENIYNSELKKLLYSKSEHIISSGIDIKIMIDEKIQIESSLIDEADLCIVIGEFLDNAIQTVFTASSKKISLYIINNEKTLDIIVESTFREKPNLSLIKKRINTMNNKESASPSSGLILNKYPNVLNNTFIQHQVFVQELQIIK